MDLVDDQLCNYLGVVAGAHIIISNQMQSCMCSQFYRVVFMSIAQQKMMIIKTTWAKTVNSLVLVTEESD